MHLKCECWKWKNKLRRLEYVAVVVRVAGFSRHQTNLFDAAGSNSEYSGGPTDFHEAEGTLPFTNKLFRQKLTSDNCTTKVTPLTAI